MSIATLSTGDAPRLSKRICTMPVVGWAGENAIKGGVSETVLFRVILQMIRDLSVACFGRLPRVYPAAVFAAGFLAFLVLFTASNNFDPADTDQSADAQHSVSRPFADPFSALA